MEQKQDISLLIKAFEASNQASLKLEEAYFSLEKKVEVLNLQLEEKNRELEENLREKERVKNFLSNVLESLTDGVIAIDLKGKITAFNRSAENITGYRAKDVEEENYTDVLGVDFFKDFPQIDSMKNWALQFSEEVEIRTKSRSLIPVCASLSQLRDENQDIIGILIVFRDLSIIKGLEEQVKRTNILAAMGEMAANIAHEVKNPLASIQLFAEILEEDLEGLPSSKELAKNIVTAVKNLDHTVSNLLLFTKEFSPATQKTSVKNLIEQSLIPTQHLIQKHSICLEKKFGNKELFIMVDAELIKQVFLNLFLNAIQAMEEGNTLRVFAKEQGSSVCIAVEDTGKGIGSSELEKIFNPFYTTKQEGTGLGLAIVKRIIEAHSGEIGVKSIVGKKTRFEILLPSDKKG